MAYRHPNAVVPGARAERSVVCAGRRSAGAELYSSEDR